MRSLNTKVLSMKKREVLQGKDSDVENIVYIGFLLHFEQII